MIKSNPMGPREFWPKQKGALNSIQGRRGAGMLPPICCVVTTCVVVVGMCSCVCVKWVLAVKSMVSLSSGAMWIMRYNKKTSGSPGVDLSSGLLQNLLAVGVESEIPQTNGLHKLLGLVELALNTKEALDELGARVLAELC